MKRILAVLATALAIGGTACTPTRIIANGPGESWLTAIVINEGTLKTAPQQEHIWLACRYPCYELIRRQRTSREAKIYDIITAKISPSDIANFYFDVTSLPVN